jgi:hypothetical protein
LHNGPRNLVLLQPEPGLVFCFVRSSWPSSSPISLASKSPRGSGAKFVDLPPTVEPSRERHHRGNGLSIGGKPLTKRRPEPLVSVSAFPQSIRRRVTAPFAELSRCCVQRRPQCPTRSSRFVSSRILADVRVQVCHLALVNPIEGATPIWGCASALAEKNKCLARSNKSARGARPAHRSRPLPAPPGSRSSASAFPQSCGRPGAVRFTARRYPNSRRSSPRRSWGAGECTGAMPVLGAVTGPCACRRGQPQ